MSDGSLTVSDYSKRFLDKYLASIDEDTKGKNEVAGPAFTSETRPDADFGKPYSPFTMSLQVTLFRRCRPLEEALRSWQHQGRPDTPSSLEG